ncbi:MAG TPA: MBOAT family O-acyltransferase [Anaerolineales bacterium]|nr:MBOAT family O-acyltransferase [Anaerolineales bacterium]
MVFSSIPFIFFFLPLVLVTVLITPRKFHNYFLLAYSLFFYVWGEGKTALLMLFVIVGDYTLAMLMQYANPKYRKLWLILTLVFDLGILGIFKYSGFIVKNINTLTHLLGLSVHFPVPHIELPIGISFFTFQSMSYTLDVYLGRFRAQPNPIKIAFFVSLFPHLVAGPIVRYANIADEIDERHATPNDFAFGIRRFIIGFGKKVLIADNLAFVADLVFSQKIHDISTSLAWLGILAYALQIFFDFSGYSDMAIGIARMLGFHFPENFNTPYIANSVQDFWRRWHISLSNWFRDYVYVPLGGNRKGERRTYLNLLIVFFLTGLWHGASWNFVIWGLWHGLFLILERLVLKNILEKVWMPIRHIYTLLVVLIGWVFFRSPDLKTSIVYLQKLFVVSAGNGVQTVALTMDAKLWLLFCVAIVLSTPLMFWLFEKLNHWLRNLTPIQMLWKDRIFAIGQLTGTQAIFLYSLMNLASTSYSPFIYFNF